MIRTLGESDAVTVLDIYQQGLDSGAASFETSAPEWGIWDRKYHSFGRLIQEQDGLIQGWAALVEASENHGIWSLYSSIFPENKATFRLHLCQGFREVGIREGIARQDGRWRNIMILERRSKRVGV